MSGVKDTFVYIGGSQDGLRHPSPAGEDFRKFWLRTLVPAAQLPSQFAPQAAEVTYEGETYTRRALYTADGEVATYFALDGMSDRDALRHLFTNYRPPEKR